MHHTVSIAASRQIKSQRLYSVQLLNIKPGSVVKIQQNKKVVYGVIAEQENTQTSGVKKQCKMGCKYLQVNGISSEILSTLVSTPITAIQKKIQMQVSCLDQKILSQKQHLITTVFLDQVTILWPGAKIPIFYDDHNFITMEPKVKSACLIDPYAAISFSVKQKNQQLLNDNQKSCEMSEDNTQIQLLLKSLKEQTNILGYDCSFFMHQNEFNQVIRILQLQQTKADHLWVKVTSSLPFTKAPTLDEFITYTQIQKNKIPSSSQYLVKIVKKINQNLSQSCKQQQQLIFDNLFTFQCSQRCKKIVNFPQRCFFNKQNMFEIHETKTLDVFLKEIQKYQIRLSQINIRNNSIKSTRKSLEETTLLKRHLSQLIIDNIIKEGQFLFLQNYYPFFISNKPFQMQLIVKSQFSKKTSNSKFVLIKNVNKDTQQELFSLQRQQLINKLMNSIKLLQIDQSQQLQHSDWIPLIRHSQQCEQDDIQFVNVFQASYKNQLLEIIELLQNKRKYKLLITTYSANGKTYLHEYLSSKCNHRSWYLNMAQLSSTNNKFQSINKYLEVFIASCPYEFIFFDNIDVFLPNIQSGDQMRQREKIISHVFSLKLFQSLQKNQKSAIFTAKSQVSIINNISFDKIIKLKNPNRKTRTQILNQISKNQIVFQQQTNFNQFIDKTQSFSLGAFNSFLRQRLIPIKHQSKIRKNDFSKIVGLKQAKNLIRSVIQKPNKFGFIYQKVKIKVPRGILLYGATGNGKTALGCAIQDQFPMKFFTVKGSDILSKYIGGSEAAVRDIFQKALSVSPSVIFFDQFESIVPRRNSSGTGVTDRVVNQFLCYLDGVSSTTGVFIVAASSRPDLIDPALLRPGRIDSHMYLEYPNKEQRMELLDLFSGSVHINHDYDQIVEDTKNFSYSDLIGFLKELRIKQSSIVLKQFKQGQTILQKDDFKNITRQLYQETLKTFRIATDLQQQQKQNDLYQRFKLGKGPQIKKQKFIQM